MHKQKDLKNRSPTPLYGIGCNKGEEERKGIK